MLALCHICPVLDACRRYRDDLIAAGIPVPGVWAGRHTLTPDQAKRRREAERKRRREAS